MRIKNIILMAVVAMAAMACSNIFEAEETKDVAIGFNTWGENLTKARTEGTSTFENGGVFYVYGYKTIGETKSVVFKGQKVSTSGGTTPTWTYSPLKFWDGNATSYTFFAVSLNGNGSSTTDGDPTSTTAQNEFVNESGSFAGTLASNTITFAGDNNDILVAEKRTVLKTEGSNTFNNYTANLNFHHIASLVDFKVKKTASLTNSTVAITKFDLVDVKNEGTYSITYNSSDAPVAAWSPVSSTISYSFAPTSPVVEYPTFTHAALPTNVALTNCTVTSDSHEPGGGSTIFSNLIVMPQTLATSAQKIVIAYTITTTDETTGVTEVITVPDQTIDLNAFITTDFDETTTSSPIGQWAPGNHYIYWLTIDANAIQFTAQITDWTTVNAYHYLAY